LAIAVLLFFERLPWAHRRCVGSGLDDGRRLVFLVLYNGLDFFWLAERVRLTLKNGTVLAGRSRRARRFRSPLPRPRHLECISDHPSNIAETLAHLAAFARTVQRGSQPA
jgi:hypothetical protein